MLNESMLFKDKLEFQWKGYVGPGNKIHEFKPSQCGKECLIKVFGEKDKKKVAAGGYLQGLRHIKVRHQRDWDTHVRHAIR